MLNIKTTLLMSVLQLVSVLADVPVRNEDWDWGPTEPLSRIQVTCLTDDTQCITEQGGGAVHSITRTPEGTSQGIHCYDPAKTFKVDLPTVNVHTTVGSMPQMSGIT